MAEQWLNPKYGGWGNMQLLAEFLFRKLDETILIFQNKLGQETLDEDLQKDSDRVPNQRK